MTRGVQGVRGGTGRQPRGAGQPAPATRIVRLQVGDAELTDSWWQLLRAVHDDERVPVPAPCEADMLGSLQFAPPGCTVDDWVVVGAGSVVGWLRLVIPVRDEPVTALTVGALLVHPRARGRGIGTQLAGWAFAEAGRRGVLQLSGSFRAPGDDVGAAPARHLVGRAGGETVGFGRNQVFAVPEATVPVTAPQGFSFVRWGSTIPDEHVVTASALETGGGLGPLPDPAVCQDPAAQRESYLRRFEVMRLGRQRRAHQTGVLDADGRLVGFSSLSMTRSEPTYALQGMTVVHESARGHRLGLLLKQSNLAYAREHEGALRFVVTGNESTNRPMLAVNAAMGFRIVESEIFWRVQLPG